MIYGSASISYAELNQRSNQLAHLLKTMGVGKDTPVAICLERSIELIITMLAILKAGGAYVPLDASYPKERLLFILNDTKATCLITLSTTQPQLPDYAGTFLLLDTLQEVLAQQPNTNLALPSGNSLAYIIYTSGSTGVPKGVLIEHHSVVNYAKWLAQYSQLSPLQRVDFSSNYVFDMAVSNSIVPIMLGLTIVICDEATKKNIRRYFEYLAIQQINLIKTTPSFLKVLTEEAQDHKQDLPFLQSILLGGENLRSADCLAWLTIYPTHTLYNEYGPTETTVGVSMYPVTVDNAAQLAADVPIGMPGSNISFYILDNNQQPAAPNTIGELYIGGACLARGYLNQPQLTTEKFICYASQENGMIPLYRTGDLCRQIENQPFEYLGRIDQQVKIHGFRIELKEIELALGQHDNLQDVVVLAQETPQQEKHLVAYVILKNTAISSTSHDFRHFLQTRLPQHMIPAYFIIMSTFPRTDNDKLDHAALPRPQCHSTHRYVAPNNTLEQSLCDIWSETLGVNRIGIEDNFFELGGHSLSAMNIIAKIEKIMHKEISLETFYSANTIAQLALIVQQASTIHKQKDPITTWGKPHTSYPLTDFQFVIWISHLFEPKVKKLNLVARKRVSGHLKQELLCAALYTLLQKHQVLSYRISAYVPKQMRNQSYHQAKALVTIDHRQYPIDTSESLLIDSLNSLIETNSWKWNRPQLILKLFHLPNGSSELQIALPHILSDNLSLDLLFSDLSEYYLLHQNHACLDNIDWNAHTQFSDYALQEQAYAQAHFSRDYHFWKNYQQDVDFFPFPKHLVIDDMASRQIAFSTYCEIPEIAVSNLQLFCAINRVSLTGGLCAVLSVALVEALQHQLTLPQKIMLNIIKSTRETALYQDTIGCFLRVDTIKVDLSGTNSLLSLAKQIHQSILKTMPYQRFASLAKLALSNKRYWHQNPIKQTLTNTAIYFYTKLFSRLKLNHRLFSLYAQLGAFQRKHNFIINLNVLSSFITETSSPKDNRLFGLPQQQTPMHPYDLLKINTVLEVCFLRDDLTAKPYLVLSGNLDPKFREQLAQHMLRLMQQHAVDNYRKTTNTTTPVSQ